MLGVRQPAQLGHAAVAPAQGDVAPAHRQDQQLVRRVLVEQKLAPAPPANQAVEQGDADAHEQRLARAVRPEQAEVRHVAHVLPVVVRRKGRGRETQHGAAPAVGWLATRVIVQRRHAAEVRAGDDARPGPLALGAGQLREHGRLAAHAPLDREGHLHAGQRATHHVAQRRGGRQRVGVHGEAPVMIPHHVLAGRHVVARVLQLGRRRLGRIAQVAHLPGAQAEEVLARGVVLGREAVGHHQPPRHGQQRVEHPDPAALGVVAVAVHETERLAPRPLHVEAAGAAHDAVGVDGRAEPAVLGHAHRLPARIQDHAPGFGDLAEPEAALLPYAQPPDAVGAQRATQDVHRAVELAQPSLQAGAARAGIAVRPGPPRTRPQRTRAALSRGAGPHDDGHEPGVDQQAVAQHASAIGSLEVARERRAVLALRQRRHSVVAHEVLVEQHVVHAEVAQRRDVAPELGVAGGVVLQVERTAYQLVRRHQRTVSHLHHVVTDVAGVGQVFVGRALGPVAPVRDLEAVKHCASPGRRRDGPAAERRTRRPTGRYPRRTRRFAATG